MKKGEGPDNRDLPLLFFRYDAAYCLELVAGFAGVTLLGMFFVDLLRVACRLAAVAVVAEIRGRLDQPDRRGGVTHVTLQALGTDMPVMYGFKA